MEREEILATFQHLTNMEIGDSLSVLEKTDWDLDRALAEASSRSPTSQPSVIRPASESEASVASTSAASTSPASTSPASTSAASTSAPPPRITHSNRSQVNTRTRNQTSTFSWLINLFWMLVSNIPILRYFLGATPNRLSGTRDPNPTAAAHRFQMNFQEKYGNVHPAFFQGSYTQALQRAAQNTTFLIAYVHCEDHQDTEKFCKQFIPSEEFRSLIHENSIVFWAGDIKEVEPYQVGLSLHVSSYPFLGLVGMTPDNKMTVLGRIDGYSSTNEVISKLKQLIARYEPNLRASKHRKEALEMERQLRQQQQEEYEQALKADQERERKKREELEKEELEKQRKLQEEQMAQALEENRKKERERKLKSLPEEPPAGKGVATIRVKLPSGSILQRRFLETEKVQTLYDFVESNELPYTSISLFTNIPKKIYEDKEITLKDAGLCPSVQLFIDGTNS